MSWSGSWNGRIFTGTYRAPDGTVFNGTWTQPEGPDSPDPPDDPLSSYDPFFLGPRTDDSDSMRKRPWSGLWNGGVYTGKYRAADGTEFNGTMTRPQA